MMAPSRGGVCFEGRMFFVYDREAVKKESDPPENAIVYFYPPGVNVDQQITICGQLVGMANFMSGFTGNKSPALIKLKTEKVVMIHVGKYTLALGGTLTEPDSLMSRQLDTLYHVFAFYHGSIDCVRRLHRKQSSFLSNMSIIWDCYLPFVRHYGDHLPGVFDPIPFVDLPKKSAAGFMKASHFLQACQRRRHVLLGCLLYNNSVLCTQLDPDITSRVLLLKPNQSHHPAQPVETDFPLPFGLRILDCFVTLAEYVTVYDSLAQSPYRQLSATNSSVTFPDVYSTPGNYGRNNSSVETASMQSNVTHSDPQRSGNPDADVGEDGMLCIVNTSKGCDSSTGESRRTRSEGHEFEETRGEESPEDASLLRSAQVELSGRISETRIALDGETMDNKEVMDVAALDDETVNNSEVRDVALDDETVNNKEVKDAALEDETVNNREVMGASLDADETVNNREVMDAALDDGTVNNKEVRDVALDDETVNAAAVVRKQVVESGVCDDKMHNLTTDVALLCEHELIMDPIDVQDLQVIEFGIEESACSVGQASPIMHESKSTQIPVTGAESRQPTFDTDREDVCSEGRNSAVCEDTESVSVNLFNRTVSLGEEAGDASDSRDMESRCRDVLDDVTSRLESCESLDNVASAVTRSPLDTLLFEAEAESSKENVIETCAISNGTGTSNENCSSSRDGVNTDTQMSCEVAPPCRCTRICEDSCRSSSATKATEDCVSCRSKVPVVCDSKPTRKRNVNFEGNVVEVFCVKDTVAVKYNEDNDNQSKDTAPYLDAQSDLTASNEPHRTDSGVSLNNVHTEEKDDMTSAVQHHESWENDVIPDATSDSGCTSRSSVSRDEETLEEGVAEGYVNQVEGMAHVNLYVQAHSKVVLILLAEPGLRSDQEAIKALWESSLSQLGELEALVKQSVGSIAQSDIKEDYSYLVFDRFEKAMKGNLREPVTQSDHVFCDTAKFVHEQFDNCPSLRDVTLRSRTSGVYCKRSLGRETYFQQKGSFRAAPGVPSPRDPTFTLETRTCKVLLKEHGINVF